MPGFLFSPLLAGLASALLLLLVVFAGAGALFLFLPTLPLFWVGLGVGARSCRWATAVACLAVILSAGIGPALFFILVVALPCADMAEKSVLSRSLPTGQREWFPIGRMMLTLACAALVLQALLIYHYSGEGGGFAALISGYVHGAFKDVPPDYQPFSEALAGPWSFLIPASAVWMWALLLYAHGALATALLKACGRARRPDYALRLFTMSGWALPLLGIAALASMIGSADMQFLGKVALVTLALPYFFLGLAVLSRWLAGWPNSRFLLLFLYFMMLTQFWPALAVAAIGLWQQIKCLSADATSSKS